LALDPMDFYNITT